MTWINGFGRFVSQTKVLLCKTKGEPGVTVGVRVGNGVAVEMMVRVTCGLSFVVRGEGLAVNSAEVGSGLV